MWHSREVAPAGQPSRVTQFGMGQMNSEQRSWRKPGDWPPRYSSLARVARGQWLPQRCAQDNQHKCFTCYTDKQDARPVISRPGVSFSQSKRRRREPFRTTPAPILPRPPCAVNQHVSVPRRVLRGFLQLKRKRPLCPTGRGGRFLAFCGARANSISARGAPGQYSCLPARSDAPHLQGPKTRRTTIVTRDVPSPQTTSTPSARPPHTPPAISQKKAKSPRSWSQ